MIERVKWTMLHYNLTAAQFADKIGVQRSAVSHVLSGRNKPSLDFLIKIKKTFPDVNFEWLALGSGKPVIGGDIISSEDSSGSFAGHNEIKQQPELDFVPPEPESAEGKPEFFVEKNSGAVKDVLKPGVKGIIRVVLLYSDGSFESYETGV